jgi:hypothetical protein
MRKYNVTATANPPIALSLELRQRVTEILNQDDIIGASPKHAAKRLGTSCIMMLRKENPRIEYNFGVVPPDFRPEYEEDVRPPEIETTMLFELVQRDPQGSSTYETTGIWVMEIKQTED